MRTILVVVALAACTKPNPNRCCVSEADCNANGIPVGSSCEEGLVCRGNQCIADTCIAPTDCDQAAPYCNVDMGLCAENCSSDSQCPGFMQAADEKFCVTGDCVSCRAGMNDCPMNAPVCASGSCRACTAHSECASGVCGTDGSCALEASIAYVGTTGSAGSDCTRTAPCTLGRALTIMPARAYVLISGGTYSNGATTAIGGVRHLIGQSRPTITVTAPGPVFSISPGSDITFEGLQISGATGVPGGSGIRCADTPAGARTVQLIDVVLTQNAYAGLHATSCTVKATRSSFVNNTTGLYANNSTAIIDRCTLSGNQYGGMNLDGGTFAVTNTFIVRNANGGAAIYSTQTGNKFEFNTIVDNTGTAGGQEGFQCNLGATVEAFPNNIIARNGINVSAGATCTYPSSIVATDVSQLAFKSPDAAPYDYHLMATSIAIDMATITTLDHDFDGDHRPLGNGRDVGADEAQ